MTIQATHVGKIPTPLPASQTVCGRCGQQFNHSAQNVLPGSPCGDCRPILRQEGDRTVWRRPPSTNRKTTT